MAFGGVSVGFQWVLALRLKPTETPPNAIKTQVIQTTGQVRRFFFFPYFELFCTIVILPYKLS